MNKLALLIVLGLGPSAPQADQLEPSRAPLRSSVSKGATEDIRGPAARGDSMTPWEESYSAEAAGKLEAALSVLSGLPASQRNGYLAEYRRGWLLYRLARYADSVTSYRNAVTKEPGAVEARVALLLPLMALARWKDVAQGAEDVLKIDPENYLATQRLALAKFSTQRFSEAEAHYRRLLELYPSDIEMRAGLAWTVLRMGKQSQAVTLFNQVLEVSGSHASALRGLQDARGQKASR